MAKGKSKFVLVLLESLVSGHKFASIRPRNNEKVEVLKYDPLIQQMSIYKEIKKYKGAKR